MIRVDQAVGTGKVFNITKEAHMSMTVYPITGSALSLTATDMKSATGVVPENSGGLPEGSIGGLVTVTQDREVTKAGSTRVMIKVAYKAPYRDPGNTVAGTDALTMGEISAHCVLTVPRNVANILNYEATGATDDRGAQIGVVWIATILTSLLNDKSLASLPETTWEHPLVQAIVGKLPLNVETGTYGSAS